MCELFAMSSRIPTSVSFSFERLALRGGHEGPHRDGWGVAFYEGRDALLLREPLAASESELVHFIERHGPPSELVISHIRLATHGERALRNTQPFTRELGGYTHVFAHNGELEGIARHLDLSPGRFRPVGDTDSEQAFCILMNRLAKRWDDTGDGLPSVDSRLDILAAFAADLRPLGPANFLYADGDTLFIHAHRRTEVNDKTVLPGLYVLERTCREDMPHLSGSGVALATLQQALTLAASVPLTEESWRPLADGELLAVSEGRILESRLA